MHPKTGLPKDLVPPPRTLEEWQRCLQGMQGWINAGVEDDIADVMRPFGLGEVVAAVNPDLTIYSNRFAAHKIFECLGGNVDEKPYRLIMNYDSFIKMASRIHTLIKKNEVMGFNADMSAWIKDLVPRVFWVNYRVPEKVANHMRELCIGEVITAEGKSDFLDLHLKEPDNDKITWDECGDYVTEEDKVEDALARCCGGWECGEDDDIYEDDIEDGNDEMTGVKGLPTFVKSFRISDSKEDNTENKEFRLTNNSPFRFILNQKSLFTLIMITLQNGNVNVQGGQVNVYEALGGEDEDLVSIFSKMAI